MAKYGDIEFERRVFPRFVIHFPFSYELDQSANNPIRNSGEGVTANASQGGLQVYLPEKVELGTIVRLNLALPENKDVRHIQAKAKVVWAASSAVGKPSLFKVGLEFIDIPQESLDFLKWFEHLWLEQTA